VDSKFLEDVDQHIACEILAGDDVNLLTDDFKITRPAEFVSSFQKRQRMGKESTSLRRQYGRSARATAFAIQLDAKLPLQRDESVPHALFGNAECIGRTSNLTGSRNFDEGRDLIGAEMRQAGHGPEHTSNSIMNSTINNYSL
jgi:hypothetical protein